jgi:predicted transcriptional regulator
MHRRLFHLARTERSAVRSGEEDDDKGSTLRNDEWRSLWSWGQRVREPSLKMDD